MHKAINPAGWPVQLFYSQGIEATGTRTLYISGQVGVAPDGSVPPSVGEQAKLAIGNLNAVLAAAGMSADNVVKSTIYLTDPTRFEEFTQAGAGLLASPPPATTLLFVKALANPALLVEIEAIAVG